MQLKEKIEQGFKEAIVSRGKRKGMLKTKCPKINTYGAAVWQAIQGHCNPYKVGIGHCILMNDDKREVYEYINKVGNYVDLSTFSEEGDFLKLMRL